MMQKTPVAAVLNYLDPAFVANLASKPAFCSEDTSRSTIVLHPVRVPIEDR
jgi:hypothetical protein